MKQIEYKGVVIRPRTITFEEFQQEQIERYKNDVIYHTDDGEYVRKFLATERFYWDRQTHWFVNFPNGRVVRIPKRKWSEDDKAFYARIDKVITKVEKENKTEYGKFSAMMQKIVNDKIGKGTYLIYPTTYGIGLWAIYNFHFEDDCKAIEAVLKDMGVEYYNEFSDANWAYRFKISKKEANRAIIEKAIN